MSEIELIRLNLGESFSIVSTDLALDGFTLTWTRVFHGSQVNPLKIQYPETSIQHRFVCCLKSNLKLNSLISDHQQS
jgi:hypothetical protein